MAGLLQRISRRADVIPPSPADAAGASHIRVVREALPEALQPHVTDCLLRPGEVVLFAESAAWAARIRLAACEVAASGGFASLQAEAARVPRITVRVAPTRRTR